MLRLAVALSPDGDAAAAASAARACKRLDAYERAARAPGSSQVPLTLTLILTLTLTLARARCTRAERCHALVPTLSPNPNPKPKPKPKPEPSPTSRPNPNPDPDPNPNPHQVHECRALLRGAAADAWTRLLKPSLSREVQRRALEAARRQAIRYRYRYNIDTDWLSRNGKPPSS